MSKIRRVDFSPDEWLAGTRMLSAEERGLYWDCCALIYSHGGPIEDDEEWLKKALGVDVRTWRRVRGRLIELRKLSSVDVDGKSHLMNGRAGREIEAAGGRIDKASRGGKGKAEKRAAAQHRPNFGGTSNGSSSDVQAKSEQISSEINDLGAANHQPSTINHHKEESSPSSATAVPAPVPPEIDRAFALWLPVAYELRIPDPGFLNSERRTLLAERLAECGIEKFETAMANLREARWLREDDDPSKPKRWVNLANLLKPENFTGLLEGRYAERHEPKPQPQNRPQRRGSAANAVLFAAALGGVGGGGSDRGGGGT
jgi:uncharacterized protein YdaU (DUF1376 family)